MNYALVVVATLRSTGMEAICILTQPCEVRTDPIQDPIAKK